MKVKKIVLIDAEVEIKGITLLSIEEYEDCRENISSLNNWWWLRSPGIISNNAAYVDYDGGVHGIGINVVIDGVSVRPVLKLDLKNTLQIGDKFKFGKKWWSVISNSLAISDEEFCQMEFRLEWDEPNANVYEESLVKKYLESWLEVVKE